MIRKMGSASDLPLVVDLDGTLIRTDSLHESILCLLGKNLLLLPTMIGWLGRGKAGFKAAVSDRVSLDPALLPYDQDVMALIRTAKSEGRRVILASAADHRIANGVAAHLGLFDHVIATHGGDNLSGQKKHDALVQELGVTKYDYIGNDQVDCEVWQYAETAILANAKPSLVQKITREMDAVLVLSERNSGPGLLAETARLYQWIKNILLFVPLLASHDLSPHKILMLLCAFVSFGMAASSIYQVNDLIDLESDRRHPRKKDRPLASGRFSIQSGVLFAAILFILSILLGVMVSPAFVLVLLIYMLLSSSYSLGLKQLAFVDVIILAGLYSLRIIAGGVATETPFSLWLLAFSFFYLLQSGLRETLFRDAGIQPSGKTPDPWQGILYR